MRTKDKILAWKKEIDQIKKTEYQAILDKQDRISKEITTLFKRIQSKDYKDTEEYTKIGNKIDDLNDQTKALTKDYEASLKVRFSDFFTDFQSIFWYVKL